jgi:hypothetical protein
MEPNPYDPPTVAPTKPTADGREPVFFAVTWLVSALAWAMVTAIMALGVLGMAIELKG